jgi:hypothetical protein
MRIKAPSRIHSHSRLVPDVLAVAGLAVVVAVAVAVVGVGVGVVGVAVAVAVTVSVVETVTLGEVGGVVGVGVMLSAVVAVAVLVTDAARLVRLLIALLAPLPHPATRQPMTRIAARTKILLAERRIVVLPPLV